MKTTKFRVVFQDGSKGIRISNLFCVCLKLEKFLKESAVYRDGGSVWVTARDTVIVKGSSWREKMMGHIVVSSYSESTCCSISCDLTTDYIKLLLHQAERWGSLFKQRKRNKRKKLTRFDCIGPPPPVQDNESTTPKSSSPFLWIKREKFYL